MMIKKKTIGLIFAVVALGFLLFFLRNSAPFIGITGRSMEPNLKAGDLIVIKRVASSDIREGDIIVFQIPSLVRERYNYPLTIAHRVTEIVPRGQEIVWKTKGDNTGEDPFIVRPVDLRGKVSKIIPYAGIPLLFLQSQQGMYTVAFILFLIFLPVYSRELGSARRRIQKEIFSPVLEGQKEFAAALEKYGEHLKSHTGAVIAMGESSKALAEAAKKLAEVAEKLDERLK